MDVREETSLTRKASPHRYDSDEEAFNWPTATPVCPLHSSYLVETVCAFAGCGPCFLLMHSSWVTVSNALQLVDESSNVYVISFRFTAVKCIIVHIYCSTQLLLTTKRFSDCWHSSDITYLSVYVCGSFWSKFSAYFWKLLTFDGNIFGYCSNCVISVNVPSVFWHCWLGDRKGIRPVENECWYSDRGDLTGALHVLKVPACTTVISIISWCIKIQNAMPFWYQLI